MSGISAVVVHDSIMGYRAIALTDVLSFITLAFYAAIITITADGQRRIRT